MQFHCQAGGCPGTESLYCKKSLFLTVPDGLQMSKGREERLTFPEVSLSLGLGVGGRPSQQTQEVGGLEPLQCETRGEGWGRISEDLRACSGPGTAAQAETPVWP